MFKVGDLVSVRRNAICHLRAGRVSDTDIDRYISLTTKSSAAIASGIILEVIENVFFDAELTIVYRVLLNEELEERHYLPENVELFQEGRR